MEETKLSKALIFRVYKRVYVMLLTHDCDHDFQTNSWRKVRAQRGCAVPRGRRGHTALVHRGQMLIYGGYQDLRGSSSELWAFHFGNTSPAEKLGSTDRSGSI